MSHHSIQVVQIGPWEFEIPEEWSHKENQSSNSYFEVPDGSKGLYVKAIELAEAKTRPEELAEYVQNAHLRGFTDGGESNWKIVNQTSSNEHLIARSLLDLYDEQSTYRVLSLVVCDCKSAVQITVHDYLCESYSETQIAFAQLESSIRRLQSTA